MCVCVMYYLYVFMCDVCDHVCFDWRWRCAVHCVFTLTVSLSPELQQAFV